MDIIIAGFVGVLMIPVAIKGAGDMIEAIQDQIYFAKIKMRKEGRRKLAVI